MKIKQKEITESEFKVAYDTVVGRSIVFHFER
jgi:hypothetical protein